jgi:hypothetical protein
VRIRDGVGGLRAGWFGECVLRKVGDGNRYAILVRPMVGWDSFEFVTRIGF